MDLYRERMEAHGFVAPFFHLVFNDTSNFIMVVKCCVNPLRMYRTAQNMSYRSSCRGFVFLRADSSRGRTLECACEIYALLNLLAFQMHGILLLLDEGYQKARGYIRRRDEFFAGLRLVFSWFLFGSWEEFIGFITDDDEPGG